MPDPPVTQPLRRTERLNVMFVLAASQLTQILVVAVVTALLFFVLGLILLSPELLAAWTRNGSSDGTLLGMTIPVPNALIQITLFLGALTFMYVSARAAGDGEYRSQFLDPLIDDLRLTLIARNRYRAAVGSRDRHSARYPSPTARITHNVARVRHAAGPRMVPASRAAAGADPASPVPGPDRAVGTDGQWRRRADRR